MRVNGEDLGRVPMTDAYRSSGHMRSGQDHTEKSSAGKKAVSSQNRRGNSLFQNSDVRSRSFKKLVSDGKKVLSRLWNGPDQPAAAARADEEIKDKGIRKAAELHSPGALQGTEQGADSVWQRFRLKVYQATGYLAKRFGAGTAFQFFAGSRDNGEKHHLPEERYSTGRTKRRRTADPGYLGDSYDKSGRYTRLGQGHSPVGRDTGTGKTDYRQNHTDHETAQMGRRVDVRK